MGKRIIIDELEFDNPFGKIAAKTWHEDTDHCKHILALHGWMDNASSFDGLIPHIKHENGVYVCALDLPGHGRSSQLPPGVTYTDFHFLMEIRRCLTELEWIQPVLKPDASVNDGNLREHSLEPETSNFKDNKPKRKFTIVGHSLGGGLGLFYASLFPDDVEEVILLDFLKTPTTTPENMLRGVAEKIDEFVDLVSNCSPYHSPDLSKSTNKSDARNLDKGQVIVSQEAAIVATIEAHKNYGDLSREAVLNLLSRSTVAINTPPNSVIYSRDLRLRCMLNLREHWEINKIFYAGVKCHVLSILGTQGIYKEQRFSDHMEDMIEFLKSKAQSFHLQWIESDHFLQMNRSKETADIINKYLAKPQEYEIIE